MRRGARCRAKSRRSPSTPRSWRRRGAKSAPGRRRSPHREAIADRRRWWPLAAAATVAAIAVGVLQLTTPDQIGAPASDKTIVSDMPAPASRPAPEMPATPSRPEETKPEAGNALRAEQAPTRADSPRRQTPAPESPRAGEAGVGGRQRSLRWPNRFGRSRPARCRRRSAAAAGHRRRRSCATARGAGSRHALLAATARPAATADAPGERRRAAGTAREDGRRACRRCPRRRGAGEGPGAASGSEWIALIRRLRDEGKSADAAKELAAFRVAHADHEKLLPPDLRDWRPPRIGDRPRFEPVSDLGRPASVSDFRAPPAAS